MSADTAEFKPRITREGGWVMMLVALFLDFLPFIVLIGVMALLISAIPNVAKPASQAGEAACNSSLAVQATQVGVGYAAGGFKGAWSAAKAGGASCKKAGEMTGEAATMIAAGIVIGGTFWISPFIFFVSTIVASLIALLLFPLWFYFGKKYVMVSFIHTGKVMTNFTSMIFTTVLKWFPIINLFPFPVYTLTVWRHIQIARKEDKKAFEKAQGSKRAVRTRNAYANGVSPRVQEQRERAERTRNGFSSGDFEGEEQDFGDEYFAA